MSLMMKNVTGVKFAFLSNLIPWHVSNINAFAIYMDLFLKLDDVFFFFFVKLGYYFPSLQLYFNIQAPGKRKSF